MPILSSAPEPTPATTGVDDAARSVAPAMSRPRGAAAIAAHLRRAIVDGQYVLGDRLPAERHLARALTSSRATVREALRILEQGHLITRRVGSGTYVAYSPGVDEDDVAENTSPLELIEVRLVVEPGMVRLATINATAKDIEGLGATLDRLDEVGADTNLFTKWDRHFHQRLAEAARNPLIAAVYRQINHVRGHAQWEAMKDDILSPERIAAYNHQHRALFRALSRRDADGAVAIIVTHLEQARRDLISG